MERSCQCALRLRWLRLAVLSCGLWLGSACSGGAGSEVDASGGAAGTGGRPGTGGIAAGTGGSSNGNGGGGAHATGGAGGGAAGTGGSVSGSGGATGAGGSRGSGSGGATPDAGSGPGRDSSVDTGTAAGGYNPCPPSGTACTIMPLGDSITDGFTVRGGYRIPFFQRAHQEGRQFTFVGSQTNGPVTVDNVPFPQHHEGHSAHTIYDAPMAPIPRLGIARYVPTVIPQYHPDIILLMIGTNDVDGNVDLPNAPSRLGMLIDTIISLDSHSLIVVAQITPTMQDPLNQGIRTYNAGIPAVVKSRADAGKHVVLVDMYSAFVRDPAFKQNLLADRLHPNSAGYQVMSDIWNTAVHDLLR
jgi:lysophospholipase L1-like esterase